MAGSVAGLRDGFVKEPIGLKGEASNAYTLWPPADSPKMVTLSGLPPKLAILVWTHLSDSIMSKVPKFVDLSSALLTILNRRM